MEYSIIIIPSFTAILVKILIFWLGKNSISKFTLWIWIFFCSLFAMNFIELVGFLYLDLANDKIAIYSVGAYYAFAIMSSISFLAITLEFNSMSKTKNMALISIMLVGLLVLVIPGMGLSGVQSIGYSYTRIPGAMYWVLQLIIPGGWLLGFIVLIYVERQGISWIARRRALAMLIASSPTGLGFLAIIILMQIGFKVNATLVISMATNFLLAVLIYTEYEFRLFHFLSSVPNTEENKLMSSVIKSFTRAQSYNLSRISSQFEKLLIENSLRYYKDNKTKAAKTLGISRNTLKRKLITMN